MHSRFLKNSPEDEQARGLSYVEGFDTIGGCKFAALELFMEIKKHHGIATARRIFRKWAFDPSQSRLNDIKNAALLDRYDYMPGKQSKKRLARELAKEGGGPSGSTSAHTQEQHLRRIIKKREKRDGKIHRKLRAELEEMREDLKKFNP
jgi:hypothetical protein